MKKALLILCLLVTIPVCSQEKSFQEQIEEISRKIERITQKEKEFLKEKIREIQEKERKKEITKEQAETLKKEASEYHAKKIDAEVALLQKRIEKLVVEKANKEVKKSEASNTNREVSNQKNFTIGKSSDTKKVEKKHHKKRHFVRRTHSDFVLAWGINNVINDHKIASLDDSEYRFWNSRSFELGLLYTTNITRKKTYLKYGISFVWNNLKPKDNKYHVDNGNTTSLETFNFELSESKLSYCNIIIPAQVEFKFLRKIRLAAGGYGGIRIKTNQKLEYINDTDRNVKEKINDDYNMSNFTYGLSAMATVDDFGVFARYDLSPLFKNSQTRNVSFGIRWEL